MQNEYPFYADCSSILEKYDEIESKIDKQNKNLMIENKTLRDKIEKYCEENNLNPKIDESNSENIYSRNNGNMSFLNFTMLCSST